MHKTNTLLYFFNRFIIDDKASKEEFSLNMEREVCQPSKQSIARILAFADAYSPIKPKEVKEIDLILN